MARLLTGIADAMVSAIVPKATAAAACKPYYYTRCSTRPCAGGGEIKWRERWYLNSNCFDYLSDATYQCNCG
jgi:hypothetical protein